MSRRWLVRTVIALLIAVVLGGAYSIVAKNEADGAASDAPAGFMH